MTDVADRIKSDILRRIGYLEEQVNEHVKETVNLESRLEKENQKMSKCITLLHEAKEELNKVEEYIKFTNEMYGQ